MKLQESKTLQVGGIILMVFSLALLLIIIPAQIKDVKTLGIISPRLLPQILACLLVLLSICLILSGFYTKRVRNQKIYEIKARGFKFFLIILVILCGYILVVDLLGYIPTTAITLGVFMWFYGQRKFGKVFFITALLLPFSIYMFFTRLLRVRLP
ncbi:tripartite tricarboxylate transporter TctB family protein [Candidatus Atribacteria bacterium 1244-E10-H5-B2]|nr:MAG: tripartite tricarboxylate transporter TctB family protein [Candidatus Atribacteria bacterium 1244-E10-H5-B2]